MRRANDLPRARPWSRISGRAVLIIIGLVFFLIVVFGRAIANFYVDALWHDSLGRSDVFWGQLGAKATLFGLFFLVFLVIAGINLFVADRTAPTTFPANVHPYVERFHEVFGQRLRLVRYGTALVLAFMLALPATAQWQDWLLFRNSKSFGVQDEQFNVDVGFYVFELPFISFAIDWLFAALVIVTAAHAGRPPVERWCAVHLVDAHRAGRHQGPPRRTAGRTRGGEGGRLLADPLRAHQRDARVRPGRHVHRGQGAAAGDDAAGPDRTVHGAAVPVDDPYRQVAPAAGRLGSVAGGGDHRRADLSGDRAVAGGQAEPGRSARRPTSPATSRRPGQRWGSARSPPSRSRSAG